LENIRTIDPTPFRPPRDEMTQRKASTTAPASTVLMLVGATVGWGVGSTATRFAVGEMGPFLAAFLRFGFGALLLLVLLARRGELRGLPAPRDWPLLVVLGFLGVTGFGALYTSGLKWTSSAEGTLIHGISPLVTLLLGALLLGERIRRWQALGGLVAFGGLAVLLSGGSGTLSSGQDHLFGDLLILGAALCWSGYSVAVRMAAGRFGLAETSAYSVLIGSVLLVPLALIEPAQQPIASVGLSTWLAIGYLAVASSCYAYLWWNDGIRTIGAGRAALFTFVVPLAATLSAIPLLGEWPSPVQLVGGALILSGLFVASR
jgi:drug/metabolite transporter (DMT)-like permease